eukprot:6843298-Prymnesium_polylepis.1
MMRRLAVADATRGLRCPGWHEIRALLTAKSRDQLEKTIDDAVAGMSAVARDRTRDPDPSPRARR